MRNTRLVLLALLALLMVPALGYAQPRTAPPAGKSPPPKTTSTKAPVSIVLVHGAWADGSSWNKVIPILEDKGYKVTAVHLPLTSPADDEAAVTRAIERQPGDVVLVAHSYGGFVISRAGNSPKVKKLVYVDAFGLDDGETVNSLFKGKFPPWYKTLQVDSGGYVWLPDETVKTTFAQDLTEPEQKLVAATQGPVPAKGFDVAMKDPAWRKKPSWYVRGTADKIIPPEAQEMMAKRMKATLVNVEASHVSMLSKPREVATVILDAAGAPAATAKR